MEEDLDLDGERYAWLLTIFYIAYITFQWQNLMWKIIPPHRWACFIVFAWQVPTLSLSMAWGHLTRLSM